MPHPQRPPTRVSWMRYGNSSMADRLQKLFVVPETHAPYHSKRAWAVAMKAARGFKPDILAHAGDLADFYAVSAHSKDPGRIASLKDEILEVRKLRAEM